MNIQELREKRSELLSQIENLRDRVNDPEQAWDESHDRQWATVNAEFDRVENAVAVNDRTESIARQIDDRESERHERTGQPLEAEERDWVARRGGKITEEIRCNALAGWCAASLGVDRDKIRPEYRSAAERVGIDLNSRSLEYDLPTDYQRVRRVVDADINGVGDESRATMTTATDGSIIPEGFVRNLEIALIQYGAVREISSVMRTPTGNPLPWPTVNDTAQKGALLAEGATAAEQEVTTSAVTFNAYKFSSKLCKVSAELVTDSSFSLAAVLGTLLGERIARIQEEYWVTGTGSSQPSGLVTGASAGITAAATGAVTAAEWISFQDSLDRAYESPSNQWLMTAATLATVRQLTDDDGRFIWQTDYRAGAPSTLLGRTVSVSPECAGLGAGNVAAYYGDFSKFVIREAANVSLRRLTELFAQSDTEGFIAFARADSAVIQSLAIKKLTMAAS